MDRFWKIKCNIISFKGRKCVYQKRTELGQTQLKEEWARKT
jgi:hypothetical protein